MQLNIAEQLKSTLDNSYYETILKLDYVCAVVWQNYEDVSLIKPVADIYLAQWLWVSMLL